MKSYFKLALITCLAALLALPVIFLKVAIEPYHRGFFCEDTSIRYPYLESTVSSTTLYIVSFLGPLVVVALVELGATLDTLDVFGGLRKAHYMYNVCLMYSCYLLGASANALLTNLAKYTIGRLRPHFIDVCQPDLIEDQCLQPLYIDDYTCQGNKIIFKEKDGDMEEAIKDGYLSFVSGHASMSTQAMVFIVLYTQARLGSKDGFYISLLLPLLQLVSLTFAFYTSLTRVSDNKHHAWDVVAGALLGFVIQMLNFNFVVTKLAGMKHLGNNDDAISLRSRFTDNTAENLENRGDGK